MLGCRGTAYCSASARGGWKAYQRDHAIRNVEKTTLCVTTCLPEVLKGPLPWPSNQQSKGSRVDAGRASWSSWLAKSWQLKESLALMIKCGAYKTLPEQEGETTQVEEEIEKEFQGQKWKIKNYMLEMRYVAPKGALFCLC